MFCCRVTKPYTLVGPTVTRPVLDPLAVNTSTTDYIFESAKNMPKKSDVMRVGCQKLLLSIAHYSQNK